MDWYVVAFFVVCFRLRMSWFVILFVWYFLVFKSVFSGFFVVVRKRMFWYVYSMFGMFSSFAVCHRCAFTKHFLMKRDSALKNTHDKRDNALNTCSIRPPAHTPHELQCTHNVHDTRQRNNTQRTTCMEHETHNKQRSRYIQMDRTRPIVVWILAHANVAHEAAQCSDTVWRTEQFRLPPWR